VGHFGADASECGINFAGTAESGLDVRKNVFRADLLDEIGFLEQVRGLIAGAAQQQRSSRLPQAFAKRFERMQAGCVDRGHVPEPHNDDCRKDAEVGGGFGQLFGRPE
jgi:hypothetical protein